MDVRSTTLTRFIRPLIRYVVWLLIALVVILLVALSILWYKNYSISHPLPFENEMQSAPVAITNSTEADRSTQQQLNIVASPTLKEPLDKILNRFTNQQSHITVLINYIDESDITVYLDQHPEVGLVLADAKLINKIKKTSVATKHEANDDSLKTDNNAAITPNEANEHTLNKRTQQQLSTFNIAYKKTEPTDTNTKSPNNQTNNQASFNTLLDNDVLIQGYIIKNGLENGSQDSAINSFRQFILASNIQNLMNTNNINSIETYKNNVVDLFNRNQQPVASQPLELDNTDAPLGIN